MFVVMRLVGCPLCNFKIGRLGQGFCYLSVSHVFCPSCWCVSMAFDVY